MTTSNCPICNTPATPAQAPFCSPGCRNRDLLQWLNEGYRVPVHDDEQDGLDSSDRAD